MAKVLKGFKPGMMADWPHHDGGQIAAMRTTRAVRGMGGKQTRVVRFADMSREGDMDLYNWMHSADGLGA